MARTFFRIHSAGEAAETVLDPRRPDGWVAGDEEYETQPLGVSACTSIERLRAYASMYSMAIQPGDVVLEMSGDLAPADDRDQGAVRAIVGRIVAVHPIDILREQDAE